MPVRYEELIAPRLCDETGAGQIVKKIALFRRFVESGWIAPVVRKHSCTLFAVHQVHACCDLLENGYYPGEKDPNKTALKAARQGAFRPAYLTQSGESR